MKPRSFLLLAAGFFLLGCGKRDHTSGPKEWPVLTNEHLGIGDDRNSHGDTAIPTLRLTTKWADGRLFYIFVISPATDRLKEERKTMWSEATFTIQLKDKDGFVRLKKPVFFKQMTAIVNQEGSATSFEIRDDVETSKELYDSLSEWSVAWSGIN